MVDSWGIIVVAILLAIVALPPHLDPAIRLKEWLSRRNKP